LLVCVVILGAVQIGYLFYAKRELQRAADFAALAGARALELNGRTAAGCTAAGVAVGSGLTNNKVLGVTATAAGPYCGTWAEASAQDMRFNASSAPYNAVRVVASITPVVLVPGIASTTLTARAVARIGADSAAFSVGSKLVDANPKAPLFSVLKFVGADVGKLCVGCYDGLASAYVTPAGLLSALEIPVTANLTAGGLNDLLVAEQIKIGDLVNAAAEIVGQNNLVRLQTEVLSQSVKIINSNGIPVNVKIEDLLVQLGSSDQAGRGLFAQITSANPMSALDASVDVLSLVTSAIAVGNGNNAASVALSVPGLGISVESRIVEPPSIAIGPVGVTAYNSQVRTKISVSSEDSILSAVLKLLSTKINVPLIIDVANSYGTLDSINCNVSPPQATIAVTTSVVNACAGNIDAGILWSKAKICEASNVGNTNFVTVAGVNLLSGKAVLPLLAQPSPENVTLAAGESKDTTRNQLAIGTTVKNTVDQLLKLVVSGLGASNSQSAVRIDNATLAGKLAKDYLVKNSYNVANTKKNLVNDGVDWNRPGFLGLLNSSMVDEWEHNLKGCTTQLCKEQGLTASLQTANTGGLLGNVLGGLVNLVAGILNLGTGSGGTPLLSVVIGPILEILQKLLDPIGTTLANGLLGGILGLDIGKATVHVQSLSCGRPELVY